MRNSIRRPISLRCTGGAGNWNCRSAMAEAGALADVEMERVSFKGTVDAVRNYAAEIRAARSRKQRAALWDELVKTIAADLVPQRPGRTEPRALKRRPKPYARLTKPRH